MYDVYKEDQLKPKVWNKDAKFITNTGNKLQLLSEPEKKRSKQKDAVCSWTVTGDLLGSSKLSVLIIFKYSATAPNSNSCIESTWQNSNLQTRNQISKQNYHQFIFVLTDYFAVILSIWLQRYSLFCWVQTSKWISCKSNHDQIIQKLLIHFCHKRQIWTRILKNKDKCKTSK